MSHVHSAENHDWDLTLTAAWNLLMAGQAVNHLPTPGVPKEKEFSCFTGSMLLSFCAIESFSASVAFSMPREERFKDFDFTKYRRTRSFWEKLQLLCNAIPYQIDRSQGLFQRIGEMQDWRNLVTHASPYEIGDASIENTTDEPMKLHVPFHIKEYVRRVNPDSAKGFYRAAFEYIVLIKKLTGIEPRARATYVMGEQ
jgi:hypothetical protein